MDKRNRDRDDQGRTPIAQENQDHDGGKTGGDYAFPHDSLNRRAHEKRLIEQSLDVQLRAEVSAADTVAAFGTIAFMPLTTVSVEDPPSLKDRHQHAAHAVLPHDVGLRRKSVAHVRHIAQVKRGRVRGLHRQIVQFGDGLRSRRSSPPWYSVGPILVVPAGRIRFCAATALTMSAGANP